MSVPLLSCRGLPLKELQKIADEVDRARAAGKAVALATVVGIEGSAYRLPGARMLIVDGKWVAGSISGGCLEDDVVLRAREAVAKNEPSVALYDTTSDDDVVFGVGLGCKGIITILIEPIRPPGEGVDFIGFAKRCLEERIAGTCATVIRIEGDTPAKPGRRLVSGAGVRLTDIGDSTLESAIEAAMRNQSDDAALVTLPLKNGSVLVFIERIV